VPFEWDKEPVESDRVGAAEDAANVAGILGAQSPEGARPALAVAWPRYERMLAGLIGDEADLVDVDHLLAQVLERSIRGAPRFRGASRLGTWLHTIAQRVIADYHLRKNFNLLSRQEQRDFDAKRLSHSHAARRLSSRAAHHFSSWDAYQEALTAALPIRTYTDDELVRFARQRGIEVSPRRLPYEERVALATKSQAKSSRPYAYLLPHGGARRAAAFVPSSALFLWLNTNDDEDLEDVGPGDDLFARDSLSPEDVASSFEETTRLERAFAAADRVFYELVTLDEFKAFYAYHLLNDELNGELGKVTYRDIAEALGCSETTARNWTSRASDKLAIAWQAHAQKLVEDAEVS